MTSARPLSWEWVTRPRRWTSTVVPLLLYTAFAVLWVGRGVVLHPQARVFGDRFSDKTIEMWSFMWFPHQLFHGHDPFVTHVVWAPRGINLAWVTTMPGASLLLSPLSETLGPVFAYNVAALAALPLAAWTTFLLARRLSSSWPTALVAGFLFGFSPYIAGQSAGHLNLTLVFLIPLLGYLAVVYVQGDLGRARYVCFVALALTLQFYVSTEVFATSTLMAAICFVITWLVLRDRRETLNALGRYTLVSYLITGVLALPFLWHAFAGGTKLQAPGDHPASEDLANVLVPAHSTWLRPPGSDSIQQHFASFSVEQGAYLGLPLLAILLLAAFTVRGRRRRGIGALLLMALASTLLAVGPRILVDGHRIAPGPWALIGRLPAIQNALPIRLDMYTGFFAALVAAMWLAEDGGRRRLRYALALIAVIVLLPTPSSAHWTSEVPQPTFFTTNAYSRYVHPGQTALVLPYGSLGWSMLWQAETKFRFSMVGGWVGPSTFKTDCPWYWEYRVLDGLRPADSGAGLRRFLISHHVRMIVEEPGTPPLAARLIRGVFSDLRSREVTDATVYLLPTGLSPQLPKSAPRFPPLTTDVPRGFCRVRPYLKS